LSSYIVIAKALTHIFSSSKNHSHVDFLPL
jgi:hypothetical protein